MGHPEIHPSAERDRPVTLCHAPCHAPLSRSPVTLPCHAPVSRFPGTHPCHAHTNKRSGPDVMDRKLRNRRFATH